MNKLSLLALIIPVFLIFSCAGSEESNESEDTNDSLAVETDSSEIDDVEINGYQVGDYATDFSLLNVDDQMVSLSDYDEAKGFIVIFTCNHCPYSVAYEDRIIALDGKYKDQGYPVIAIQPNDPELMPDDGFEEMKVRAEEKGFTFPYLMDEGQKIFPQYGATKTPHVYVLEKTDEGNKVAYIGAIDDNHEEPEEVTKRYVEDAVDALLKGEQPAITETVAIGCSIKSDK